MVTLRPLSADPSAAVALARRAIQARTDPGTDAGAFLSMLERDVAEGSAPGALRIEEGRVTGIAVWERPNEVGTTLEAVYGIEGRQAPAEYRTFLVEIQRSAGPILFAPRGLAGLSPAEEAEVMGALGFARFGDAHGVGGEQLQERVTLWRLYARPLGILCTCTSSRAP